MINAHDDVNSTIEDVYVFVNATIYRDVPDEDGLGYHYVGDLAADLPELIETQENVPYSKYVTQEQADGTSKQILTEATGTLTTWQFEIREGATWHNGEVLDAEDIIYPWKMLIDPVMVNPVCKLPAQPGHHHSQR